MGACPHDDHAQSSNWGIFNQHIWGDYNQHSHADRETAQRVGERHGKAVILVVEAGLMFRDRIPFHQADNGVWLVPSVSPAYLAF